MYMTRLCEADGCDRPHSRKGWCGMHANRMDRNGTLELVGGRGKWSRPLPSDRFWARVDKSAPGGCWLWTGCVCSDGYGTIGVDGKTWLTHRYSWLVIHGREIPEGLVLDHLCKVRRCVNPDHLEPVTIRVNALRSDSPPARHARKTHCVNGHEFTPENTSLSRKGHRICRTCDRRYDAAREKSRKSRKIRARRAASPDQ